MTAPVAWPLCTCCRLRPMAQVGWGGRCDQCLGRTPEPIQCAWCHATILKATSGTWYHRLSSSSSCRPGHLGSSQATPSARGGAA